METLHNIILSLNDFIWTYILIAALLFVGIMFSVKTQFIQFRKIGEMFRLLGDGFRTTDPNRKGISSLGAFFISVASRVGTGNLAGVATALAVGGPGAVFWMWLIALLGAASSFAESSLAQLYKRRGPDGTFIGGPAYYMEKGLGRRWMGVLFAVIITVTFGLCFNSVQSNTIAISLGSYLSVDKALIGVVLAVLSLIIFIGGVKRIASISGVIVPIMAGAYILVALGLVIFNIGHFWEVIKLIFQNAFGFEQAVGGGIGMAIMQGVRRGLFSNEAGMGSAPNAAATADVSHPAKQGLVQSLGVFVDTLVVCSCTAFIILISGVALDGSVKGIELTQMAINNKLGAGFGTPFVVFCITLFAFTSVLGNYYYGEANIRFITKKKIWVTLYQIAVAGMVFFGAVASLDLVWNLADLTMAIMAFINLVAIFLLRDKVVAIYRDYRDQRKKGIKSPKFVDEGFELWK